MKELALLLNKRRRARGSIDFDLPEAVIEFDDDGRMLSIVRSERNIAHRLIEEFMLAANEAVAEYLEKRGSGFAASRARKAGPKEGAGVRRAGARVWIFAGGGGFGGAARGGAAWRRRPQARGASRRRWRAGVDACGR